MQTSSPSIAFFQNGHDHIAFGCKADKTLDSSNSQKVMRKLDILQPLPDMLLPSFYSMISKIQLCLPPSGPFVIMGISPSGPSNYLPISCRITGLRYLELVAHHLVGHLL